MSREPGAIGASAEVEARLGYVLMADGVTVNQLAATSESAGVEARTSPYDVAAMERELARTGSRFIYLQETSSTMDIAKLQGLVPSVVVADHQTAGRGRFSREWQDVPAKDILVTYVKSIARNNLPRPGSTVLSQMFVLAAWSALRELYEDTAIQIRWPNDLTAYGRKLGGVLLMEGARDAERQAILFGLGINVHNVNANEDFKNTDYGAISLDEFHPSGFTRSDIVLAINREFDMMLPDLAGMDNAKTRESYAELWSEASSLTDRTVRISGIGLADDETIEGEVLATHFDGGIELKTRAGAHRIIKEFGRAAKLEVID